ncbi:MAG: hypothetical protein HQM10_13225 [Candidatus Riflebacteria bacterium]|nr:hypothetical protein [Candidatus Riflebacteria bacterium]
MKNKSVLIILFLLVVYSLFSNSCSALESRFKYMGSSMFTLPNAYSYSGVDYIYDNDRSITMYRLAPFGKFLELSGMKRLNGDNAEKFVLNCKVTILEEDKLIPQICWGMSDYNKELGSRIFYFAATKTLDWFGITLNAGMIKHPITTDKQYYYGIEKTILPLISAFGERYDDSTIIGFKLRAYPEVSFEYGRYIQENTSKPTMIKLSYFKSFF